MRLIDEGGLFLNGKVQIRRDYVIHRIFTNIGHCSFDIHRISETYGCKGGIRRSAII